MQNIFHETKEIIFLNTPKDLKIDLLFSNFKKVFIPKIQFLIHQINFNHSKGGYQLHKKNHSSFLGIKDGELTKIITSLVDNNIIVKTGGHWIGERSNKYSMVNPFDRTNADEANKHTYQVSKYTFLQKWVADKYIVRSPEESAFIKSGKKSDLEIRNHELIIANKEFMATNKELMEQIKQLQEENKALREQQVVKYESVVIKEKIMQPKPVKQAVLKVEPVATEPAIKSYNSLSDYDFKFNHEYATFNKDGECGKIKMDEFFEGVFKEFAETDVIELLNTFIDADNGYFRYYDINIFKAGRNNSFEYKAEYELEVA